MYRLFARPGWGSALVETQLAWYCLPYEIEDLDDLFKSTTARERLRLVNPLAQVPTLLLPDGQVLTESAAITLHLADATQSADLVPGPGENARPAFLRWLVFLVANVYPTFTYADDPARCRARSSAAGFRDERRRLSREIMAAGRSGSRCAMVVGAAVFRPRHLYRRNDPLAAAARLVRGGMPAPLRGRTQSG